MVRSVHDEFGFAYTYEDTPSLWWWRVRLMAAGLRQAARKRLGLAVLLALVAVPASAQSIQTAASIANTAALLAHAADLSTTVDCISAGRCQESNPIWRGLADKPVPFSLAKMGTASALLIVKQRYQKAHPKRVLLISLAETAVVGFAAYRNTRIGR